MILVVRQALVDLSARQVGKAPHDIVDAGTVNDQSNHIMHSDPSAIYCPVPEISMPFAAGQLAGF